MLYFKFNIAIVLDIILGKQVSLKNYDFKMIIPT